MVRSGRQFTGKGISRDDAISKVKEILISDGFNIKKTTLNTSSISNRAGDFWLIKASCSDKSKKKIVDLYVDKNFGKVIKIEK